jgi:hypothetical protein
MATLGCAPNAPTFSIAVTIGALLPLNCGFRAGFRFPDGRRHGFFDMHSSENWTILLNKG